MFICLTLGGPKETAVSFEYMYFKYKNTVYNIIKKYIFDADFVDDVMQETFVRFYGSMGMKQDEEVSRKWLFKIAKNTAIYLGKREETYRRRVCFDMEEEEILDACILMTGDIPLDAAMKNELAEKLKTAVHSLKPIHSEVITLKYVYQYTPKEISAILNIPQDTVYSRLKRAHDILYNQLFVYYSDMLGKGAVENE